MNDMYWDGTDNPEGAVVPVADASDDDKSVIARAIRRVVETSPPDEVAFASKLLWSYVADLERDWEALEAGRDILIEAGALKKAITSARDVRAAAELFAQERNKVDKLRKDIAGGVGGGCLDLDAARDEIGRRLACLRRAG